MSMVSAVHRVYVDKSYKILSYKSGSQLPALVQLFTSCLTQKVPTEASANWLNLCGAAEVGVLHIVP